MFEPLKKKFNSRVESSGLKYFQCKTVSIEKLSSIVAASSENCKIPLPITLKPSPTQSIV